MTDKSKRSRKSKYGEETQVMRIPLSLVPDVEKLLEKRVVLQAVWDSASILPPVAQRIVDNIVEQLIVPDLAIIEVFKERGRDDPAFLPHVTTLEARLSDQRKELRNHSASILRLTLEDDPNQL